MSQRETTPLNNKRKTANSKAANGKATVTPDLVRQVADKVYALWRRDVQIEQERQRRSQPRWSRR